ncbi:hypothetical protein EIY71_16765 [Pseudomonas sp. CH235]|nr:hypothetical protein EIY71_16765 [Pseudomonas sp. CH235]
MSVTDTAALCGSGGATIRLARESGVSDNIYVECQAAFASKPAPTGGRNQRCAVLLTAALLSWINWVIIASASASWRS